jgi:hypothetical protein
MGVREELAASAELKPRPPDYWILTLFCFTEY